VTSKWFFMQMQLKVTCILAQIRCQELLIHSNTTH
jgi:hypothetical protein